VFRTAGPIETLEVPETLHALVAARLDGLTQDERRLVQDSAVLGKTFTKQGLAALTGLDDRTLEPILASLLRKEILAIQADPRSPERGQYAFLQDIIKRVAYETLSRHERKAKHLAAARFLESTWSADEDEIVEVVAAHYLDAYEAAPEEDDADQIKERARETLVRAAERAALLAANAEAQAAFERAAELADDPLVQAKLRERAGIVAYAAGRADAAAGHFEGAAAIYDGAGATHAAASVSARLAEIMWDRGRLEEGLESMDRAFQGLAGEEPDEHLAALAAQLGKFRYFAGDLDAAAERIQTALDIAEALWLPETFSEALNTKAILLNARHHPKEAHALLRYALDVALENDKPSAALRAYFNLSEFLCHADHYEDGAGAAREGLALARRVGTATGSGHSLHSSMRSSASANGRRRSPWQPSCRWRTTGRRRGSPWGRFCPCSSWSTCTEATLKRPRASSAAWASSSCQRTSRSERNTRAHVRGSCWNAISQPRRFGWLVSASMGGRRAASRMRR
jgi:tetratricopeptide (TPR) repeat protein